MIIALIPARAGSKRIPNKNLQKVGNFNLIEWSIIFASKSNMIDRVYVSSDIPEEKITSVKSFRDLFAYLPRSSDACSDDATDRDVVMDLLYRVNNPRAIKLIVYLRPTTPIRPVGAIDEAIRTMIDIPALTGLRSVHEMSESAWKCFSMGCEGRLFHLFDDLGYEVDDANAPNQGFEKTYHGNGVVDIMRPEVVIHGATFGDEVFGFETKPVIEIDTPFDLQMARMQLAYDQNVPAEFWRCI